MILNELTLHNFGGYRGRHTVELTPPSREQPIVLFGGLNGAGKTTLLDALQLVLYGKRARCSGRGNLAYEEYLRRSVNRAVLGREGAAIELAFQTAFDGRQATFRVHRGWQTSGSGTRERLSVSLDGDDSMLLTERWDEIVEELMPLDIASLFFFDGEKIEALADPDRAGTVVATAIESLLGLGLLGRLEADLNVLERKKRASVSDSAVRDELAALDQQIDSASSEQARRVGEKAARRNDLDRAEKAFAERQDEFRQHGGELFEQRVRLDDRRQHLTDQFEEVTSQLQDLAAGSLPLGLVPDLMEQIVSQVEVERDAGREALLLQELADRDRKMISELDGLLSGDAGAALESFIKRDTEQRRLRTAKSSFLRADDAARERLAVVWPHEVKRSSVQAASLTERHSAITAEIVEVDRMLAAVPAAAAVAELAARRDEAGENLAEARARFTVASEQVDEIVLTRESLEVKRDRLLQTAADALVDEEDAARIVDHAGRVKETLAEFRAGLLDRHLSRIEAAILDSFQRLLRKQGLVADLRLDPETFKPHLFDRSGAAITPERLSAGERQLLAVGILWGLARVSGRRLPTVIDTPLGRLDSSHRQQIADRYFPSASDQVLLLSTDEEIDERLLEIIRPSVGRSYELCYDDSTSSTAIEEGYFFSTKETVDVA